MLVPIAAAFGSYSGSIQLNFQFLFTSISGLFAQFTFAATGNATLYLTPIANLHSACMVNLVRLIDSVGAAIAILYTGFVVGTVALAQTAYSLLLFVVAVVVLKAQILAQMALILAQLNASAAVSFTVSANACTALANTLNALCAKIQANLQPSPAVVLTVVGQFASTFNASLQLFVNAIVPIVGVTVSGSLGGIVAISHLFGANIQNGTEILLGYFSASFGPFSRSSPLHIICYH